MYELNSFSMKPRFVKFKGEDGSPVLVNISRVVFAEASDIERDEMSVLFFNVEGAEKKFMMSLNLNENIKQVRKKLKCDTRTNKRK